MSTGRKLQVLGLIIVAIGILLGIVGSFQRDDSKPLYFDLIGLLIGGTLFLAGRSMERRGV